MSTNGNNIMRTTIPKKRSTSSDPMGQQIVKGNSGILSNGNIMYALIGATAISLGIGIFLYREMKQLKSETSVLKKNINETKTKLDESSDGIKNIYSKMNIMAKNMQLMHNNMKNSNIKAQTLSSTPSYIDQKNLERGVPSRNLPVPRDSKIVVLPDGPPNLTRSRSQPNPKISVIEEIEEEEEEEEEEQEEEQEEEEEEEQEEQEQEEEEEEQEEDCENGICNK